MADEQQQEVHIVLVTNDPNRAYPALILALGTVTTGILILQGDNDTQTPIQQAFLLEQKLTQLNHYDHTLLTYPNLGHLFYPSSQWLTGIGPIEQYVLADLYAWLEAHSGLSHSFATTGATSHMAANMTSLNTNTSNSSSSGKR